MGDSADKEGLLLAVTRVNDTTIELFYDGVLLGPEWVEPGELATWEQTLTFAADGNSFTATGRITQRSGPCQGEIITHTGQGTRK